MSSSSKSLAQCLEVGVVARIALAAQSDLLGFLTKEQIVDVQTQLDQWLVVVNSKRRLSGLALEELPLIKAARSVLALIDQIRRGKDRMDSVREGAGEAFKGVQAMLERISPEAKELIGAPFAGMAHQIQNDLPDPEESARLIAALQDFLDALAVFGPLNQYEAVG